MSITNQDVADQLDQIHDQLEQAAQLEKFMVYAPLVGYALHEITRQHAPAVGGVWGSTAKLLNGTGRGYKLVWTRDTCRLTINHRGSWKSERLSPDGVEHHVMSKGRITPLHDSRWARAMTKAGHGRTYPKQAVAFFAGLLKNNVDTAARIA